MIKTKRGSKSKPIFEYTTKFSSSHEPKPIPMLDGAGYARLISEAYFNVSRNTFMATDNYKQIAFDPEWEEYYNYSQNTDWIKEITQVAYTQEHNFSVRGGGDKSKYNMSIGYNDEGGTTIGNNLKKLNLRSSLDYDLSTKLQFRSDIMFTRYDQENNYGGDVRGLHTAKCRTSPFMTGIPWAITMENISLPFPPCRATPRVFSIRWPMPNWDHRTSSGTTHARCLRSGTSLPPYHLQLHRHP